MEADLHMVNERDMQTTTTVEATNKEVRDRSSVVSGEIVGVTSDPFYDAPVILVMLAGKSGPNHTYDNALVMGNLVNAAHILDLDSYWTNRAKQIFERGDGKQMLGEWGIEGGYEGIDSYIPGYATEVGKTTPRKTNRIFYMK